MLLAEALAKFRKGSRRHLLKLINPLSVRKGPFAKKKCRGLPLSGRKAIEYLFYDINSVKGEYRIKVQRNNN